MVSVFFNLFISIFLLLTNPSSSVQVCKPASCNDPGLGLEIRFPFWLTGKQDERCGYPGFDLSCNNNSQTILTLPHSGDFEVSYIDYYNQAIYINDPDDCLAKRIFNFNANASSFKAPDTNYSFFNCSMDFLDRAVPVECSYGETNSTILVTRGRNSERMPRSCVRMPNVSAPLMLSYEEFPSGVIFAEDLELVWSEPDCRSCAQQGLLCGFTSDSVLDVGCLKHPGSGGLPRSAIYGIIIGLGIPGLVCLIGLLCFACGQLRKFPRRSVNAEPSTASANLPSSMATVSGLDEPTIASYPKTVIGESRHLPKLCDRSCAICLSEYQPKETLRSIPECNHYFHATCLDEWLKLNGTCPLCRNSPESNSLTSCSSSVSSTFSISPTE